MTTVFLGLPSYDEVINSSTCMTGRRASEGRRVGVAGSWKTSRGSGAVRSVRRVSPKSSCERELPRV